MDKIDFKAVAQAALGAADSLLAEWLPEGRYKGAEFFALNPTRSDKHLGSFTVNTHTGMWADYATGDRGGDLVSLYAYLNGVSQGDAARALSERLRLGNFAPVVRREWDGAPKTGANRNSWTPIAPFPVARLNLLQGAAAFRFAQKRYGKPGLRSVYRDAQGQPLCVVQRFVDGAGGKADLPFVWAQNGKGEQQWCSRRLPDPQPLLGLDDLARWPSETVLLVEGEKCRAAASDALRDFAAVSWLGGCNGWKKADWQPLAGRDVVIWPDCDSARVRLSKEEEARGVAAESKPFVPWHEQPGMKAALGIAQKLHDLGCRVRMVKVAQPGEWPDGYDVADALSDGHPQGLGLELMDNLLDYPDDGVFRNLSESGGGRENARAANEGGAGADFAQNNGWRDDEIVESDEEENRYLAELLENYRQIGQKQKALDLRTGETFSRSQLAKLFSERAANVWFRSDMRRILTELEADVYIKECRLKEKAAYNRIGGMLDRYIYMDGTTDAFDTELDSVVSLAAVKAANAEDFADWEKSPARMVCPMKNLVFEPGLPPGVSLDAEDAGKVVYINEFKGFPMRGNEPDILLADKTPFAQIKGFFPACRNIIGLLENLCVSNGEISADAEEWVFNWLARRFRFPQQKPMTALVFISEAQGVGKSTLGQLVLKGLFGDYYTKVNQNALESQFNAPFDKKIITVMEEISPSDERKNVVGKLKDMVTSDTIMIERKGRDPIEKSDYNSFLIFSNDDRAIPIEAHDRRFMVLEVKNRFTEAQWLALHEEVENGGLQAFADFLCALPLMYTAGYRTETGEDGQPVRVAVRQPFTAGTRPLETPIKRRMIGLNQAGWEAFFAAWYQGELDLPFVSCAAGDLWRVYLLWCNETKMKAMAQKNFYACIGKRLSDLKTRVKVNGVEKRLRLFVVGHSELENRYPGRYPLPTTDSAFRDGSQMTMAAYLGYQAADFNRAAACKDCNLPTL
jgi:hypothetical protein